MICPDCDKECQHPDPVYAPSEYYCSHCKKFLYDKIMMIDDLFTLKRSPGIYRVTGWSADDKRIYGISFMGGPELSFHFDEIEEYWHKKPQYEEIVALLRECEPELAEFWRSEQGPTATWSLLERVRAVLTKLDGEAAV